MSYLIGCDPEVFVRNMKTGRFVSAHGMVKGTKTKPEKVERGAIQVDGCALEFNINPASSAKEFDENIARVIEQLKERVFEINKDYALVFTPYAEFDPDYFVGEVPMEAKVLGCDPDFNALTGEVNPNPGETLQELPFRTAAGHIHVGWQDPAQYQTDDPAHFADCQFVAKSVLLRGLFYAQQPEEYNRLKHYGMNGSFRPKPYGVELREPSNIWVADKSRRLATYESVVRHMESLEKK